MQQKEVDILSKVPVALQLYSIREYTAKDFLGTLKAVAEMGYAGVEFAGYGNIEAGQMRKALDDLGLVAVSSHNALADIENKFDELVEYNQTIGNRFITVPNLPERLRKSYEDWVNMGVRLNSLGARCRQKGMQLCYHNHAVEFVKYDDRYALDIMYGASGADLVQAELDIYWVKRGGDDPVGYLRKLSGRCPLLHLKDMEPGPEQFFAEVGTGVIDLDGVVAAANAAGVTCFIVEQDKSRRDPMESVRISIDNLKARGLA
jgi:sugar phosphate isomerase/epimerase